MDLITISIAVLFGLGLTAALILSVASKLLYVKEDPRVEAVTEALPGANCGGCGYAGCEGYANAVINDPAVPPNKCCAGGAEVSEKVAALSGKAAGDSDPMVAFRRCDRNGGNVQTKFDYQGVPSCAAAKLVQDGPYACRFSCLGFGDCVRACPFNAMQMVNNIVYIDVEACTACGTCTRTCPNQILELIPKRSRVMVFCSSQDKAKDVTAVCEVGCISCQKCVKKCPAKAITMVDSRVHIDHAACLAYGEECKEICVAECPRKILRCLGPGAAVQQAA
jgi:Na+-translocating ferredoxin:NAD+ oxidoreductase subunit B